MKQGAQAVREQTNIQKAAAKKFQFNFELGEWKYDTKVYTRINANEEWQKELLQMKRNFMTDKVNVKLEWNNWIYNHLPVNMRLIEPFGDKIFKEWDYRIVEKKKECINDKIFSERWRAQEMTEEIKWQNIEFMNYKRRKFKEKIHAVLRSSSALLQRLQMTITEYFKSSFVIPEEDFQKVFEHTKELFSQCCLAIKHDNYRELYKILDKTPSLTQMFDDFQQTLLHIAAKRSNEKIMKCWLEKGAKIDCDDFTGRTPLHVACANNNLENVLLLWYELASPFRKDHWGLYPLDLTNDGAIRFFIERAKNLANFNKNVDSKTYVARIRSGLDYFMNWGIDNLRRMFSWSD